MLVTQNSVVFFSDAGLVTVTADELSADHQMVKCKESFAAGYLRAMYDQGRSDKVSKDDH